MGTNIEPTGSSPGIWMSFIKKRHEYPDRKH